jgi:hypothetical protein
MTRRVYEIFEITLIKQMVMMSLLRAVNYVYNFNFKNPQYLKKLFYSS